MQKIEPVPWVPYVACGFLSTIISPDWWVFEWGSGGSTVYWAQHCTHVVSIEHDEKWYKIVQDALAGLGGWEHQLIPGTPGSLAIGPNVNHPDYYYEPQYPELNFVRYVREIERYPGEYFDLVFVDGMARQSCIKHGLARVKPGGWLLLDNSDMAALHNVLPLLAGWERMDFHGPGRGFVNPWQATFWRKPLEA